MLERDSLSKQVYTHLKKTIILQETPGFRMGEKINEAAIAKMYECSVTPVRESINMLRGDGLIVGDSYRSSSIVHFTEKDVRDFFELRECLEIYALRKSFPYITKEMLALLHKVQDDYQSSYLAFDECGIIDTNHAFHDLIIQLAGNRALVNELGAISDRISMMRAPVAQRRHEQSKGNDKLLLLPVQEHAAMLTCMEAGDLEGTEQALRLHLNRVKEDACEYYRTIERAEA